MLHLDLQTGPGWCIDNCLLRPEWCQERSDPISGRGVAEGLWLCRSVVSRPSQSV